MKVSDINKIYIQNGFYKISALNHDLIFYEPENLFNLTKFLNNTDTELREFLLEKIKIKIYMDSNNCDIKGIFVEKKELLSTLSWISASLYQNIYDLIFLSELKGYLHDIKVSNYRLKRELNRLSI